MATTEAVTARARNVGRSAETRIIRVGAGTLGAAQADWAAKSQVTSVSVCNNTATAQWVSLYVERTGTTDRTYLMNQFRLAPREFAVVTMSLVLLELDYLSALAATDDAVDVIVSGFQNLR